MYFRTKDQVANIFTKALPKEKFCKFRDDLGIFPNDHYGGRNVGRMINRIISDIIIVSFVEMFLRDCR